jgi:hypothetical protein
MWPFSEMSLSTAALVGTIANWALFGSLLVGLVSTFVIAKTADRKEEFWDHARQESNERIAELNKGAAELAAEAIAAKGEIAKANQGAAEANARAAEAQLALEKFKQPRALSEQQIVTISENLMRFAGTRFDAAVLPGDPEAFVFLSHITATLERAGWTWVDWIPTGGPLELTYSFGGKPNVGQQGFFQCGPSGESIARVHAFSAR